MRCGHFVYDLLEDLSPIVLTGLPLGLAETLEGVYQASGYGDLPLNKSIWFVLLRGFSLFFFTSVVPTGSGSLPHAITLTPHPSSRGFKAA